MENVVELLDIRKSFSGNEVLHGASFRLRRGEVHAIVGENGAGKSTLMNILMGSFPCDAGEIRINGELQQGAYDVRTALEKGITIIPQELALVPAISVGENIMLNQRTARKGRMIDWRTLQKTAGEHLHSMGFSINPYARLDALPIAYRQIVSIVKAVSENKQVVIMDEPTSSLSRDEVLRLHGIIRDLKAKGTTIIYISHLLDEIFAISDRITIMRDGNVIDTKNTAETHEQEIVTMMVGDSLYKVHDELMHRYDREGTQAIPTAEKKVALSVRNLKRTERTPEVSFDLHAGEILGVTGLVGSGKTELARCIFGQDKFLSGEIWVDGAPARISSPEKAIRLGMMMVPEDRKLQGLVLPQSVEENITLAPRYRKAVSRMGFRNLRRERDDSVQYVRKLKIKLANLGQRVRSLSGGNQQKAVLSRALLVRPSILILDEPTRGIDVGAKAMMYTLIHELKAEGMAILFLSSDINEVPLVSDRLLVLRDSRVVTEISGAEITNKNIIKYIAGGVNDAE